MLPGARSSLGETPELADVRAKVMHLEKVERSLDPKVRDAVAAQIRKGRTDLQIARHYTLAEFNLSDAQIQAVRENLLSSPDASSSAAASTSSATPSAPTPGAKSVGVVGGVSSDAASVPTPTAAPAGGVGGASSSTTASAPTPEAASAGGVGGVPSSSSSATSTATARAESGAEAGGVGGVEVTAGARAESPGAESAGGGGGGGGVGGVGITLRNEAPYEVLYIAAGGAVDASGAVRVGDVLMAVDGAPVAGRSIDGVRALLIGPPSSPVSLSFSRPLPPHTHSTSSSFSSSRPSSSTAHAHPSSSSAPPPRSSSPAHPFDVTVVRKRTGGGGAGAPPELQRGSTGGAGPGFTCRREGGRWFVSRLKRGGFAETSRQIDVGDEIVRVGSTPVAAIVDEREIASLVAGPAGSTVQLHLRASITSRESGGGRPSSGAGQIRVVVATRSRTIEPPTPPTSGGGPIPLSGGGSGSGPIPTSGGGSAASSASMRPLPPPPNRAAAPPPRH